MSVSYGRAAAVFQWANDNWSEFDGWCCAKGIDPLELPAYRFYNLILYKLKEDLTDEGLKHIEQALRAADSVKHPVHELGSMVPSTKDSGSPKPGSKARPVDKEKYVPSWYRGEDAAYMAAKAAMHGVSALPKMGR